MTLEQNVVSVVQAFERQQIRYGMLGGLAMTALGAPRSTMDADFLVHRDDLEQAHMSLSQLGYTRHLKSENASHYRRTDDEWGAVDLLHAFREASVEILPHALTCDIFDGQCTVKVLRPEDVIGFKIQALANNPTRWLHDQSDIEALVAVHKDTLDWERVQQYYDIFDRGDEGQELRRRCGKAQ